MKLINAGMPGRKGFMLEEEFIANIKSINRTDKGCKIVLQIPEGYPVPALSITTVKVTVGQAQKDLFDKGDNASSEE